ncbi:MAG: Spy/CpxP family protein refolding chaperone [Candidatus Omnitrophota bacterium]
MKTKRVVVLFLASVLLFSVGAIQAYAFDYGMKEGHPGGFEGKFLQKAKVVLSHQQELALSDEQVTKVKGLKMKLQKDLIRADAEIDIAAIDIKAEMGKDSIDVNAVNKLIDKKYDLKKERAKAVVAACAALKDILTKEQKDKMKGLMGQMKGRKMQGMMEKGMKGPMMGGGM